MKTFIQLSLAAMAVGASAHNHHQHAHLHKKNVAGSPVEKREPDVVTQYVVGATDVVYELNGKILEADEAKAGLKGGDFIVIGETEPTYTPPPPPPEPTTTPEPEPESTSLDLGAQFIESISTPEPEPEPTTTSIPEPEPTTTSVPEPETTTAVAEPTTKVAAVASVAEDTSSAGAGIDSDFPDGKIPCSTFPSAYGAVGLSWLDFHGWAGLQYVSGFQLDVSVSIAGIETGIKNSKCTAGCMCSYACPAGYQKTQWPSAQGADNESVGGLYCGTDNMLHLTRSDVSKKLCEKGAGGVTVKNTLGDEVAICRTDYPGTEGMYIPAVAAAGSSVELTNPVSSKYYVWDGTATTAQYYLNPKGYSKEVACVWDSPNNPANTGNWAPAIIGVGKDDTGITFISIFQNKPTSYEKLDFNVKITGDVTVECGYDVKSQSFTGSDDPDGCTTGMQDGGSAVITFY